MSDRTGRANRVWLAVLGLILLAAGAVALARGLGLCPPLGPRYERVLSARLGAWVAAHGWFWPALAAAAVLVELLALRWLLLQARTDAIRRITLPWTAGHGTARLSARAAADAVSDDVEAALPAGRARAVLGGTPAAPRVAVGVVLPDDADPAAARHGVHRALARLRYALEDDRVPAVVRLHAARRP
ncbi:hypothetical protein Sru01_12890 [Sphaerisporangium rufum]|uniref:Alkaline shock response membrane anchor protein AmaP n=1 Tax=Sphaerisporangium rufum TaxID=1381558 RepID=A0A919QYH1_9ACTN|nr:alkaline shock response membrane anchor protein AmaP [Sphaerisporangium rufum]GII76307.1 hypothetical protein Sru01_12890 [Sphaerisporangium rufum]